MKGGNKWTRLSRGVPKQPLDPVSHLAGSFIGERHSQNRRPRREVFADQVCDSVGYNARLSAPSASEQQQRACHVCNSFFLLRIQACQEVHFTLVYQRDAVRRDLVNGLWDCWRTHVGIFLALCVPVLYTLNYSNK